MILGVKMRELASRGSYVGDSYPHYYRIYGRLLEMEISFPPILKHCSHSSLCQRNLLEGIKVPT